MPADHSTPPTIPADPGLASAGLFELPSGELVPRVNGRTNDLDDSLGRLLENEIGYRVEVAAADDGDSLTRAASLRPGEVHREAIPRGTEDAERRIRLALRLPAGRVARWTVPADQAERVGRHALAVLNLETARNEQRQLVAEVDSLTQQVLQDFEELSVIRALASNLQLPQTAQETEAFVLASLRPLVGGVGAVSIAAVLTEEGGDRKRKPLWTGAAIVSEDRLFDLIDEHAEQMRRQPVVRNR